MNRSKLLIGSVIAVALSSTGFCAADADIAAGLADALLTWDAVKAAMVPIGVFVVAYSYFKRVKRA